MVLVTRLSVGGTTVVPAQLRKQLELKPGDSLEWERDEEVIIVRCRKQPKLADIAGILSHGGNSVKDKYQLYDDEG